MAVAGAGGALAAQPFVYKIGGTARYLPLLLRRLDPSLFPDDAVVDAFERFGSISYSALATLFGWLRLSAEQVPAGLYGVYAVNRLVAIVALSLIARRLALGALGAFLVVALALQAKSSLVGGVALWEGTVNHGELALTLGILALLAALHGWWMATALLIGSGMLFHPSLPGN